MIGVLLLFIILQIQTRTVILTGLSIISAAAALSILSFNYFNALRGDSNLEHYTSQCQKILPHNPLWSYYVDGSDQH